MTRALKTYQTVGTQVEGGDSFNSVLLLQAEQYQDTVKVEETLYSAVALQEGQRLSINATIVGQPDLSTGEALSLSRQLQVYDPARQQMRIDTGSGGKETATLMVEAPQVAQAGTYYVSLRVDDFAQEPLNHEFQTELVIVVE